MFAERVARQQEAVFRTFGEDAEWQGVGVVRVRRREADEELRLDRGSLIETGRVIRVRRSEVAAPVAGQTVQLLDENGAPVAGELFVIAGEPKLDRKRVWHCSVSLSA